MEEIVFRNSIGESITLSNREPFILTSIDGTGGTDTDVKMQKAPYQDGTTYVDTILEPRVLTIEAAILAGSEEELYQRRNQILNAFNPKLGTGTLTYAINDTEKEIKCIPELTPQFSTGRNNKSASTRQSCLRFYARVRSGRMCHYLRGDGRLYWRPGIPA